MTNEPFFTRVKFQWKVACHGYTIVEPKKDLAGNIDGRIVPVKGPLRLTKPFHESPGLFKQFAGLETTFGGAVGFANKFGLLHTDEMDSSLANWCEHAKSFADLISIKANKDVFWSDCEGSAQSVNQLLQNGITTEVCKKGIVLIPRSLLAAMALQLSLWLTAQDDRIGQCVECGGTWVFGPNTGHRVSRRYCSAACVDAARYRRKKSELS